MLEPHDVSSLRVPASELFLRRLPACELIYATPSPWKLDRASQVFTAIFRNAKRPDPEYLAAISKSDASGRRANTPPSPALTGIIDKQYKGEPFESAYQKWFAAGLRGTKYKDW
jgi:hypothetical protein